MKRKKNGNVLFSLGVAIVFGVAVAGCATYLLYAENDMPTIEGQVMPSAVEEASASMMEEKPMLIEEPEASMAVSQEEAFEEIAQEFNEGAAENQ